MTHLNVLFLMSDEHRRDAAGCYGSPIVQTPAIDRLAATGTRFANAYTPSPICVPARASLATGRYVHDHRFWSNAQAYDGSVPSFGHRLRDAGRRVESIGKLHYRSGEDDNGFDAEHHPMHILNGVGWARGLLRGTLLEWDKARHFAAEVGPGECDYTHFDRTVCDTACRWLASEAKPAADAPWTLFVSFVSPHYPLVVPGEYYDRYPLDRIDPPRLVGIADDDLHPVVAAMRRFQDYDAGFDDRGRLVGKASYFGLCSFVDALIGQVLQALDDAGRLEDTLIVYASDHGEILGDRSMWTKCTMFEESAGVPLIINGPGVPEGAVSDVEVSLVDCYPTVLDAAGVGPCDADADLPGRSLIDIARGEPAPERTVLSEFHDGGSLTGVFMIRDGRWKYVHYPGYRPELYDLTADPGETNDLALDAGHAATVEACESRLRALVDPDVANALAFADQAARIEALGGTEALLATPDYDFTPMPEDG